MPNLYKKSWTISDLGVVDTESHFESHSNICNEDTPLSKSHKHKVKEKKRRKKSAKEDDCE